MTSPAHLPDDDLTAALVERQRTLTLDLERVVEDLRVVRDSRGTHSDDDEHDPEGATMSAQWSHSTGIRTELEARLVEVERALLRMEQGTYGVCVQCGEEIPRERLAARPEADRCLTCAQDGPAILG